jgi:hypothetical protein
VGILATWRVTHLLHAEDGPGALFARLRRKAASAGWHDLLDCFYCLSLWVAMPFASVIADTWKECLLLWPALSGASIVIERMSAREAHALYVEEPPETHGETQNVLLREKEDRFADSGSARSRGHAAGSGQSGDSSADNVSQGYV